LLGIALCCLFLAMSSALSSRFASYTLVPQKRAIAALIMSFSLGFPVSSIRLTAR